MNDPDTANAIESALMSADGGDNLFTAVMDLVIAGERIAKAITPVASPGRDEAGGHVESLTEAVMGVTAGLFRVAESISELASAVLLANRVE